MNTAKKFWYTVLSGGGANYGLLTDLINQTGNGSDNIKIRLPYSGVVTGNYFKGTYNPATSYLAGERVSLTASGKQWYVALQNTTGNAPNPYRDNAYWAIESGVEMIQDMGDGTWMRYTLGFNQDDLIRWGTIQRGTLGTSTIALAYQSFPTGLAVGASASSVTVAAAPSSYSFTLPTGLSQLFDKVSLGASSSSMTIQGSSATPTFVNITLSTGLSLSAGDALKLENSSTVFNIARVITYNSSTGAAYIGIINGVGSGTYTSWTCYKVALVFGSWDASPTFVYLYCAIDTYNSGTGAATMTSFVALGSGTRATWTFRQCKSNPVITTSASTEITQTGQPLGNIILGRYYGTELVHNTDIRNDGTAWRYIILEGDNAGDEYDITTYNSTFVANQARTVASNLDYGGESGKAFIAFSIADGSSTNGRALIRYSSNTANPQSYSHNANIDTFTASVPMAGGGDSSGELAWSFRLDGTADTLAVLPDHNFDRVSLGRVRSYVIDGNTIDTTVINDYSYKFQSFTTFKLTQNVEVYHPEQVSKMADLQAEHWFDKNGLHYKFTVDLTQNWEIGYGYVSMIVFPKSGANYWFNTMDTSKGGTFTDDGGTGNIALSGDQIGWQSALFKSTQSSYTDNQLFALAFYRSNPTQPEDGEIFGYSGGRKLYPSLFTSEVETSGTQVIIEDRIYAGNVGSL